MLCLPFLLLCVRYFGNDVVHKAQQYRRLNDFQSGVSDVALGAEKKVVFFIIP